MASHPDTLVVFVMERGATFGAAMESTDFSRLSLTREAHMVLQEPVARQRR